MKHILDWIVANKEWVFSGIGASALSLLVGVFARKKKASPTQSQTSGKNSTNIQAGGDINIGSKK
ncbi:hypothetical protein GEV47_17505 [Glaciimonas sp. GS1]|uniref:Uncharacterized protein n=1 Tax=Glaciimonas soli TaxID=2590999 RepID=A0A843YSC9_9BURK|nr:hypothetical protein [Glaciimonas soli]